MLPSVVMWWPLGQQIAETYRTVELVMRDNRIREPMRDVVPMKRLLPGGRGEPFRAVARLPQTPAAVLAGPRFWASWSVFQLHG
eukprot:502910-Pyramimonas_sp.AAC.1